MRRTALIKKSGPYKVRSFASGKLEIHPDWPQFPKWNLEDGGGPGVLSRVELAYHIERLLNGGIYHKDTIREDGMDKPQPPTPE